MNIVCIIQARMGSTRLPGKVMKDICGETMLSRVVRRVQRSERLSKVVIATTIAIRDEIIADASDALGVAHYRGSEEDVLDRYYHAACAVDADVVVRITSDCPLVDPETIDRVLQVFERDQSDYASNILERSFPQGLDVEVLSADVLERTWKQATLPHERVHVTPYIYQHPCDFKLSSVVDENDHSAYRWTVDTDADLRFVREVYASLAHLDTFTRHDVYELLQNNPSLANINEHICQKKLEEG